jgi:hypothetical protein
MYVYEDGRRSLTNYKSKTTNPSEVQRKKNTKQFQCLMRLSINRKSSGIDVDGTSHEDRGRSRIRNKMQCAVLAENEIEEADKIVNRFRS